MSTPQTYFIKRAETEQGPLTAAQVNRLRQRSEIGADTPCRTADESTFRRLGEVLPHLKDQQPSDPAKMARLKKDIRDYESSPLTKSAFGTEHRKVLAGGFLGVSIVAVIQLLGAPFDLPLVVSLYSFAVGIPLQTAYFCLLMHETHGSGRIKGTHRRWFRFVAIAPGFVGWVALFWHFHPSAGLLFLFMSVVCVFLTRLLFESANE